MDDLTLRCEIEQIGEWHPHLFLEPHIVACVAVLMKYSPSPATLNVACTDIKSEWLGEHTDFKLEISWSDEVAGNAERLRVTMQPKPLVEWAAIAVSAILAHRVVDLGQLDVTAYGERADYRSLDVPSVLEISGTEIPSGLARRHSEKIAQALENPFGLDAYVSVCCFAADRHQVRFSYHPYLGEQNE